MKRTIKYIKHSDIDVSKYDACIKNAQNSKIYAYSWYLDIVADDWDALVLEDYLAVMPLPKRQKYFIQYIYTPYWVAELGIFSNKELNSEYQKELFDDFIYILKKKFLQIDILLSSTIYLENQINLPIRLSQKLDISKEYGVIFKNYRKGRKSDLSRARRNNLQIKWNDDTKNLITLHKENVGNKLNSFKDDDYVVLERLVEETRKRKIGEIVSVYDDKLNLLASTFLINDNYVITGLVTASDLNFRNRGVTTFLYNEVIKKYLNQNYQFDFAGSSVTSIADFFKSFGAEDVKKYHLKKHYFLYHFFKKKPSNV